MICIYCLENKSSDDFGNKEHVIPELLGRFRNNLTLNSKNGDEAICNKCNDYFGKGIELCLGRDAMEGYLRYVCAFKKPGELRFFKSRRVRVKLAEGEYEGAYVDFKYDKSSNKLGVDLVNQVGLRRKNTDKLEFFELEKLGTEQEMRSQGYLTDYLKVVYSHPDRLELIMGLLEKKGFEITGKSKLESPFPKGATVMAKITSIVDKTVSRAIAKIAFNYLAYTQGVTFALDENFNGIRKFIRYGVGDRSRYVLLDTSPILADEIRYGTKKTLGHIVTINWNGPKTTILSRVGIFNTLMYRIIFCEFFKGLYRPIAIGHHFDVRKKIVSQVPHITKLFYLP